MTDPTLDGRRAAALRHHAESIAPYYTDAWDPASDDAGTVVLELFAEMAADVTKRLDRVPEKHRVGFFDALGFRRAPPQPARLPLTFAVSADLDANVAIPERTRAVADATDGRPERTFQIPPGAGFEATPATLDRVVSVDPVGDLVFDDTSAVDGGAESVLFGGDDRQRHALYVGHEDALTVNPGGTIGVTAETDAPLRVLRDRLVWEYYGERSVDDEVVEDWHEFQRRLRGDRSSEATEIDRSSGAIGIDLRLPDDGELVETTVDGVEMTWIRCRIPDGVPPTDPFDFTIGRVAVGVIPTVEGSPPDAMRYNDVPLPVEADGEATLPFGETPQRLDAFHVAAAEAFTKEGATVRLAFARVGESTVDENGTNPRLSWEYWNGVTWARLPGLDDGTNRLREAGTVSFEVPSDLEPTNVAGERGHWIRVRLVGGHYGEIRFAPDDETGTETGSRNGTGDPIEGTTWSRVDTVRPPAFSSVTVALDSERPPLERPDHLVAVNNLAYGENYAKTRPDRFRPFVGLPDRDQTVYLGFDGPLRNGSINLLFALADVEYPTVFHPRVRWEYCPDPARDEWARLDAGDGTDGLTRRGIVGLAFPETTTAFERFGRSRHWIRARVTGDEFDAHPATTDAVAGPLAVTELYPVRELVVVTNYSGGPVDLSSYRVDFEYNQPATQVRQFPEETTLDADESLLVATGTKSDGPADVRFDYRRHVLNRTEPDVVAVLTPDGDLVAKGTYRAREKPAPVHEGSVLHARIEAEADAVDADAGDDGNGGDGSVDDARKIPCPPACFDTLRTVPPTGTPGPTAPRLRGLHPNAVWADNVRPVTDELLGSSDGSRDQSFAVSSPPVVGGEVLVDELARLSAAERRELDDDPDVHTEAVEGGDDLEAFWVRWRRVEDFLGSGPKDRHYTLDPATGTVTFGNGVRGAIPPRGRDNVTANYRTGGGTAGNVPRGAVDDLVTSLPFVDEVANPLPGEGGTDAESTDDVLARAPRELRDRDRAVTADDFERVASAASRNLAKVRCLPRMDERGDRTPGWVTLLLVPRDGARRPVPSTEVKRRVRAALEEQAPATLFDPDHLVVRGPSYVEVSVEATLVGRPGTRSSALESRTADKLEAFLHPLTGGSEADGWSFGATPCASEFYALLEGIEGVDYVDDLAVTVAGSEAELTLTEGRDTPRLGPDTLVFSGVHEITARGGV